MYGFGPGHVNGVHNHLLEPPDVESVLPTAGFTISYIGSTNYQLLNPDHRPLCTACPKDLPTRRIHIPMSEIHATRKG